MIRHARPHEVLELYSARTYYDRLVTVVLPDRSTPRTLTTAIILAVAKSVQPRRCFEFGTYLGITTLTLAVNLPETVIETIDLDASTFQTADQHPNDRQVSEERFLKESRVAFVGTPYEDRIHTLFGDSNTFDFSAYRAQMSFIYIDGGHDLRTVTSDTENAFDMLDPSRTGCIMWHDYGNPHYPELTEYLEGLAAAHDITVVDESMTAFILHTP